METLEIISKVDSDFNVEKHCSFCRCNGTTRKHNYYFGYNRKAKVCVFCEQKFNNPAEIVSWLEENAIYSRSGKLIDFKKKENE